MTNDNIMNACGVVSRNTVAEQKYVFTQMYRFVCVFCRCVKIGGCVCVPRQRKCLCIERRGNDKEKSERWRDKTEDNERGNKRERSHLMTDVERHH